MSRGSDKPEVKAVPEVENILSGTILHLGDGRRLAHGEKASVSDEIAKFLRKRGQAK